MKRMIQHILCPGRKLLILFAICISPFLVFITLRASCVFALNSMLYDIIYIMIAFAFLIAFLTDRYNNTRLKRYVLLTAGLLSVFILMQICSKNFLQIKSEERGIELGKYVETYRNEKGFYPKNIEGEYFSDAPKRSLLLTKYNVKVDFDQKINDTVCYIQYVFFDGCRGHWNTKTRAWFYTD